MIAEALLNNEASIRLAVFFGVLVVLMACEALRPRRALGSTRTVRWPSNLMIALLNTLVVRVTLPLLPVGFAVWANANGVGLFNNLAVPNWLAIVFSLLALDCAIYWQHRLMHALPPLWRLHRMHHSDTDIDVTTGARFHPLEILLSMLFKLALVGILGAPAIAVLIFEIVLNACAMFNHSNIRIATRADRLIRQILVTPDMHRIHHSIIVEETDSNFGFNLPWWDRLFGTYKDAPKDGHDTMQIGLRMFRSDQDQRIDKLLTQPARN